MTRIMSCALVATLTGLMLAVVPAQAQLMRTFVSAAGGNDANDCNLATPCRSFQGAHDKTLPDGEITVLDPGGYGAVRITKAISIVNDGVGEASVAVTGDATGIIVAAPADARVNLRGVTVQGIGGGRETGVRFDSGLSLTITNCVVRNLTRDAIIMGTQGGGAHYLSVSDTLVSDNGGSGIGIVPSREVVAKVTISRVGLYNNSNVGLGINAASISATSTIDVSVEDSVAANNHDVGFSLFSLQGAGPATLTIARSVAANSDIGISVTSGGTAPIALRIGQSVVTGNRFKAWELGVGPVLQSFGDNYIVGNGDGDPAPPTIATK